MYKLIKRMPLYHLQRRLDAAWLLPVSYTISVTGDCNARCQTCRIQSRRFEQLNLEQYRRIVDSIGQPASWLTISGGEPFLRDDLADLCDLLIDGLGATWVTLPTNGTLPQRVAQVVERLSATWTDRRFIVNLSIDEIGARHDELRGLEGSWDLALQTLERLRGLQRRRGNVTLGIHTVISKLNIQRFPEICDALLDLEPDSYITEVAEQRAELATKQVDITPDAAAYRLAIDHLGARLARRRTSSTGRLIARLRAAYYADVERVLAGGSMPRRCFAGTASCQILPDGEVISCAVRGEIMGRLSEVGFSFPALWHAARARAARRVIRREGCSCPLANQAYINMALDPTAGARLMLDWARCHLRVGR